MGALQLLWKDITVTNPIYVDGESTSEGREFEMALKDVLNDVGGFLLDKNRKYGNSALDPIRLFSRANPIEQLNVRIDDKLSRIKSMQPDDMEDAELDLLGYLILKQVYNRMKLDHSKLNKEL